MTGSPETRTRQAKKGTWHSIGMPQSAAEKLLQLWESSWEKAIALQLTAPVAARDPQLQRWAAHTCDSRPRPSRPPVCTDGS
jgi:hypothetical protein